MAVVVLAAWVASQFRVVAYRAPNLATFGIYGGYAGVLGLRTATYYPPGWSVGPIAEPFAWLSHGPVYVRPGECSVALWPAFLIVAISTGLLFWRDRAPPAGHCPECGYDLTGSTGKRCAECGAAVVPRSANARARRSR